MSESQYQFVISDLEDQEMLAAARAMMAKGQEEGAIPLDRADLTGSEDVIFCFQGASESPSLVGCAVFYNPEGTDILFLDILYVKPEHRLRGIAGLLVEGVAEIARHDGFSRVQFGTNPDNHAMQTVGQSAGFKVEGLFFARNVSAEGR